MPELEQMNDNLKVLSQDMAQFQEDMIRRQSQSVCQDLSALSKQLREIQECKGACQLQWKPNRYD